MARLKITLTKEASRLLERMKKKMHPKVRRTWLSDFVSNEILKQFYNKSKDELELEAVRFEAAKLNKEKSELISRLNYLSERAKELREKIKEKKKND